MIKLSHADLLAVLREFGEVKQSHAVRYIDQVASSNPTPLSLLTSFQFIGQRYLLLADNQAEDNIQTITDQFRSQEPSLPGDIIASPDQVATSYALPFKGRDIYLFKFIRPSMRLDVYLAQEYPEHSRSTWQKHIKAGHVAINSQTNVSTKAEVGPHDTVSMEIPQATDFSSHTLPIIYIDENVVVINKPCGILSHSKGALNQEFTVAEFFRRYTSYNLDSNRPGIIHRLDRDTSGVMIGARNEQTAALLKDQFTNRTLKKTYIAIVDGKPKEPKALINLPIGRNPSAPSTFRVDSKGKHATTAYQTLESLQGYTKLLLQPHTGRTHQLRVHMQYVGTPIHGDKVYGKPADRLYLHAASLEVTLPGGIRKVFSADLPDEFTNFSTDHKV